MSTEEILLEELIIDLESKYGFLFTYKQADVLGIKVVPPRRAQQLNDFLDITLNGIDLEYEIVNEKYILLSRPSRKETSLLENEKLETIQLYGTVKDKLTRRAG